MASLICLKFKQASLAHNCDLTTSTLKDAHDKEVNAAIQDVWELEMAVTEAASHLQ
jgi:hypothetical protein